MSDGQTSTLSLIPISSGITSLGISISNGEPSLSLVEREQ